MSFHDKALYKSGITLLYSYLLTYVSLFFIYVRESAQTEAMTFLKKNRWW